MEAIERNEKDQCIICNQEKAEGMYLYTSFICTTCEGSIIQTDTTDPKYLFYIKQLKKVTLSRILS